MFIVNTLRLENPTAKVIPWPEFKKHVYEIYDHKINNSAEINGSLNNSYLCFQEYFLIYFLDKFKLRQLAESKILDMLISLRYYEDLW